MIDKIALLGIGWKTANIWEGSCTCQMVRNNCVIRVDTNDDFDGGLRVKCQRLLWLYGELS